LTRAEGSRRHCDDCHERDPKDAGNGAAARRDALGVLPEADRGSRPFSTQVLLSAVAFERERDRRRADTNEETPDSGHDVAHVTADLEPPIEELVAAAIELVDRAEKPRARDVGFVLEFLADAVGPHVS
jgi:hypothetical protein